MTNKYKFSIIMSIYNVEKYIREAIDSLLNQTIGFKENVQLILVNDGSPDNSEEICKSYQKLYPDNIIYVKKKNGGLASARNEGLKYVEGEYVNFFDPDDILNDDVCELVYDFFKNNRGVNVAAIRINMFEAIEGFKHPLEYKFSETRVIDINKEPDCIQLSAATSFISSKALIGRQFDNNLRVSEDMLFMGELMLDEGKYGVIREAVYNYRKRFSNDSILGLSHKQQDWYLDVPVRVHKRLMDLSIDKYNNVIPYIQNVVMYDLKWRIKEPVDNNLSDEVKKKYYTIIKELLSRIDITTIFNIKGLPLDYRVLSARIKDDNFINNCYSKNGKIIYNNKNQDKYIISANKIMVQINILEITKNKILNIEGILHHRQLQNITFKFLNEKNEEIPYKTYSYNHKQIVDNFNVRIPVKRFKLSVDCNKCSQIKVKYITKNINETASIKTALYSKVSENMDNSYYHNNGVIVKLKKNILYIDHQKRLDLIKLEIKYMIELISKNKIKNVMYRLIYHCVKTFKRKPIWIISDRVNAANDNGIAFYKYLIKHEKNANIYFTLSKDYPEYNIMKKQIPNILAFRSIKYKILFMLSDVIISSQADDVYLNIFGKNKDYMKDLYNYNFVFLQHGITKDDISDWLNKLEKNIKIFVTASPYEYKSILDYDFYYTENQVKLTGFARYDNLKNKPKRKILLMPTWRKSISGAVNKSVSIREHNDYFKNSEYYLFYNRLINDERIEKALEKNDYEFHFFVHPSITNQAKDFITKNKKVIVHNEIANYNKEFGEGALLITDYSSVAFDFAYLKKPVIYTQFDKDTFYLGHLYKEGYFIYDKKGFGPVVYNYEDTVKEIIKFIENDCKLEKKYEKRIDDFFAFTDRNNCKRIYEEILKLEED